MRASKRLFLEVKVMLIALWAPISSRVAWFRYEESRSVPLSSLAPTYLLLVTLKQKPNPDEHII